MLDNNPVSILIFLKELKQNNNKGWFEAHRTNYNAAVANFEKLIDPVIDELRASDQLKDLSARLCLSRIYRDIRFSKDKSPYKTNFGAMITPGGWNASAFGYYISLEPGGKSMIAGGLHNPTTEQLTLFREAIDKDAHSLKKIARSADFQETFGEIQGERLKTNPRGYDRTHPEIALLQLKQVTAIHRYSDSEVADVDFGSRILTACRRMKPFLNYLNEITR